MDKLNQLHATSTLCFRIEAEPTSEVVCRKEKQKQKDTSPQIMSILLFSLLIFNLPCVRPSIIPCLSFPRLQTTFHTLNVTRIPKYIDSIMHFVQMGGGGKGGTIQSKPGSVYMAQSGIVYN